MALVAESDGNGAVVGGVVGAVVGIILVAVVVVCLLLKKRRVATKVTAPPPAGRRSAGMSRRSSRQSVHSEALPPLPTPPRGEYGLLPKASDYQEGWELERAAYQDGAYLEMKAMAANADGGYGGLTEE